LLIQKKVISTRIKKISLPENTEKKSELENNILFKHWEETCKNLSSWEKLREVARKNDQKDLLIHSLWSLMNNVRLLLPSSPA
jgi:hypothetical protein